MTALGICAAVLSSSCHSLDDERIPPAPVNIQFTTESQWNLYGVTAALDYRSFILEQRVPSNFPYTASSYTGFGGILLVCDVLGEPKAYDLACPVERSSSTRIRIDKTEMVAECPVCHSTYDVFSLNGHPLSGPAANNGYGLRVYYVGRGRTDYMVVLN